MRLDRFLVECGIGSRKTVRKFILEKLIKINDKISTNINQNIDMNDIVLYKNNLVIYKKYRYYKMYKIKGYITAKEDKYHKTVMELLPNWVNKKDLSPVGRLDKDTEGILLFTNDGKFSHQILSPKNHIDKIYRVILEKEIIDIDIQRLENGVNIGNYITKSAKVIKINTKEILLTINEGKYHQVKKMLLAINNKVIYLKRESFAKLTLDNMIPGEVVEIQKQDIL